MVIDAHHHFWHYHPAEYGWIGEGQTVLRRDWLPEQLEPELAAAGVDGVVSVQARQTLAETDWLLSLAARHEWIRGVVGWVPLGDGAVDEALAERAGQAKLAGVRHVVQDEPDREFLARDDFNRGVARLKEYGLVYDILIHERQLPATLAFVDRHPEQRFVVDHLAKPRIREGVLEPWRENLRALAKREQVTCKLSGMVTEADPEQWTATGLRVYAEVAMSAFGPRRMMFGSDWPVCLLGADYGLWHRTVWEFCADLSEAERAAVMGGTAIEWYGL